MANAQVASAVGMIMYQAVPALQMSQASGYVMLGPQLQLSNAQIGQVFGMRLTGYQPTLRLNSVVGMKLQGKDKVVKPDNGAYLQTRVY